MNNTFRVKFDRKFETLIYYPYKFLRYGSYKNPDDIGKIWQISKNKWGYETRYRHFKNSKRGRATTKDQAIQKLYKEFSNNDF